MMRLELLLRERRAKVRSSERMLAFLTSSICPFKFEILFTIFFFFFVKTRTIDERKKKKDENRLAGVEGVEGFGEGEVVRDSKTRRSGRRVEGVKGHGAPEVAAAVEASGPDGRIGRTRH